jgi:hypothetical protein
MTRQIEIKQGFARRIRALLTNADGGKFDMTDYDGAMFCMFDSDNIAVVDYETAEVTDDEDTVMLTYQFKPEETETAGTYKAMFALTIAGVPERSVPERDFYEIIIVENPVKE